MFLAWSPGNRWIAGARKTRPPSTHSKKIPTPRLPSFCITCETRQCTKTWARILTWQSMVPAQGPSPVPAPPPAPSRPSLPKCRSAVPSDADMFFLASCRVRTPWQTNFSQLHAPCGVCSDQTLRARVILHEIRLPTASEQAEFAKFNLREYNLPGCICAGDGTHFYSRNPNAKVCAAVPLAPSCYHTVLSHTATTVFSHTAYQTSHRGSHVRSICYRHPP